MVIPILTLMNEMAVDSSIPLYLYHLSLYGFAL
jgi:hypothetical protein